MEPNLQNQNELTENKEAIKRKHKACGPVRKNLLLSCSIFAAIPIVKTRWKPLEGHPLKREMAWILVCSILWLGLNANSTAVVIGAMFISP